jgi:hypothetical protein
VRSFVLRIISEPVLCSNQAISSYFGGNNRTLLCLQTVGFMQINTNGVLLYCLNIWYCKIHNYMIYLLTAIGLPPGGSSTVHIYTQTIDRVTQNKKYVEQHKNLEECGPCPVLVSYTLAFALQLRKNTEKTSVTVAEQ